MSSTETKRAVVWLGVAIAFLLVVLWWKGDGLFGGGKPKPKPTVTSTDTFKPIRSADLDAPKFAIQVVDDVTGKPLADARVVLFTVQATVLADERTSASGSAEARPLKGNIHAAAAWCKDYAIAAKVANTSPVEIRLTRAKIVKVDVGNVGPAQREWHKTSNAGISFKFAREFNPRAAKRDYFEFKMYEHVGIRDYRWPIDSSPVIIPRYLPGLKAKLRIHSAPSLECHLDRSGMRDQTPQSLAATAFESTPIEASADLDSFQVDIPPKSPHALIAHYTRPPGQDGVILLHVAHLDRDEQSPNFGSLISAALNPSTYEEKGGKVTFKVFDLPDTIAYLKIVYFPKGKPRELIACNPVLVHGLTEMTLSDYKPASLTVELTGQRVAGESAMITLLDDRFEPENDLAKGIGSETPARWDKMQPTRHWLLAQDSKFASGLIQVDLQPGEDHKLPIEMRPGCRVTLVVDDRVPVEAIIIRDPTTGCTHRMARSYWERFFEMKRGTGKELIFTSRRYTLFLGQGKYEFGVERGKAVTMTEAVLDAPTKRVQLK